VIFCGLPWFSRAIVKRVDASSPSPRRGEGRGSGLRGPRCRYTESLPPHPTLRATFSPTGRRNKRRRRATSEAKTASRGGMPLSQCPERKTSVFLPPALQVIHTLHPGKLRQPHQFRVELLQPTGRGAHARLQPQAPNIQRAALAIRLHVDAANQPVTLQKREDIIAILPFRLGHEDLDAVIEAE
jgi:hypothetical protein